MRKHRKGQSTVEYAIVLGVIVAALIAMQTYVKRGLQAKYHDGTRFLTAELNSVNGFGNAPYQLTQYEPYYSTSSLDTWSNSAMTESVGGRGFTNNTGVAQNTSRAAGGFQASSNAVLAD